MPPPGVTGTLWLWVCSRVPCHPASGETEARGGLRVVGIWGTHTCNGAPQHPRGYREPQHPPAQSSSCHGAARAAVSPAQPVHQGHPPPTSIFLPALTPAGTAEPRAPLRALPPAGCSNNPLYGLERARLTALPPGRHGRVIFGHGDSPAINAGAGWASRGVFRQPLPRWGPPPPRAMGNGVRGGEVGQGWPRRGVTFAEAAGKTADRVPVIAPDVRAALRAPASLAGGCAKVTAGGQDAPSQLAPLGTPEPGFPATPPPGRPTAGTAHHRRARRDSRRGQPPREGRRSTVGAPRCPRASPFPVTTRREVWKAGSSQAPVTHEGPQGHPGLRPCQLRRGGYTAALRHRRGETPRCSSV